MTEKPYTRLVLIPFLDRFREPMVKDEKTWTSRTRKYGAPGAHFFVAGHKFEILVIRRMLLGEVADHWKEEGCSSREDFVEVWCQIHPGRGFQLDWKVWVHIFRRVN